MANTTDTDLILDTLSSVAKKKLSNVLAPLSAFTRQFTPKVFVQGKRHVIPITTGGSTTLKNPTNFEQGDSVKGSANVTLDHYSQPFHITSEELNQQASLEDLAGRNLDVLADSLLDVAMTPITALNFTSGSGIIAQSALAVTDLQAGWAAIAKSPTKNCILDATAYSKFLPQSRESFVPGEKGGYGFDGFFLNTRWTGAEAGVYGFICGPDAICMGAGIPDVHPAISKQMLSQGTVRIDSLGLTVQINVWGSLSGRKVWASYDVFFGAAFGEDVDAGYRIRSA